MVRNRFGFLDIQLSDIDIKRLRLDAGFQILLQIT